jgi:hypothetical protein
MAGPESPSNQKQAAEAQAGDKPNLTIENVGVGNFIIAGALPESAKFQPGAGQAGGQPRLRSYLDTAVHPLAEAVTSTDSAADEMSGYMRGFLKTVPIFMKGKLALPALAITYMSDEAKLGDTAEHQVLDAGLGLGKGALLKTTLTAFHGQGMTPATTGMGLGIMNRGSDALLTRSNYYDSKGEFSLSQGLSRTLSVTANPAALAIDAVAFGVNDAIFATIFNKSRGMVSYKPSTLYTMSAGTMGVTSGFGRELDRQIREDGSLDFTQLARKSFLQGAFDAAGGRVGAWQATRGTKLAPDAPGAMEKARSTPFQRGEVVDARQASLRDGVFIPERKVGGVHTETWFGKVKAPSGELIPAVFRPNDKSEAFATRMQNEIAGYGMNGLGFKTNVPATVARNAEINGKPYSGYIQEMNGPNLVEHLHTATRTAPGTLLNKASALEHFRSTTALSSSYGDAFLHRMVMGEWDNHAMNMSVSDKVHNIDLGYAYRAPKSTREYVPLPHARKAYESTSAGLYAELAGKPISAQQKAEMTSLHERYSTPEGRAQMEALGLTPRQVDGVLGRTDWFATNALFPRQQEAMFYVQLTQLSQFAKGVLKKPAHKPVTDAQGAGQ